MVLIDALYISGGGGEVLLYYLIEELEKTDKKVFYLLDERIKKESHKIKQTNSVQFIKASLFNRYIFYKKNSSKFSSVFAFANLPPNIKINCPVYTYFHQKIFLEIPDNYTCIERLKVKLKIFVLKRLKNNTNFWLVQSNGVKKCLSKKLKINEDRIKVLPFYPSMESDSETVRNQLSYLYVSNGAKHKNHNLLIESFCDFYDIHKKGILVLTIGDEYQGLIDLIGEKKKEGYPINNLGFIERKSLGKIYRESEFLIFPSLSESFGLGLIESIDNGCKVIGADLPYTYEVCQPTLIFNPYSKDDIVKTLSLSLNPDLPLSESKVKNQIQAIINSLL